MIKLIASLALPLCLMHPIVAVAADFHLKCPSLFAAKALTFSSADLPAGWTPFMSSNADLRGGAILLGPPATMMYSKPSSSSEGPGGATVSWQQLWEIPDSEKWLSCTYGDSQELTLSAPLPRDVTACTLKKSMGDHGQVTQVALQCKRGKRTP